MAKIPKRRKPPREQLLDQAKQRFQDGDWVEAEELASRFLELTPQHGQAMYLLVRIALGQGELSKAEALLKEMLIEQPNDWDWWLNLANVERSLGKFQDAANHLSHIVNHDRKNAIAWGNLGITLAQLEQYEEAIAALETAKKLMPESTAFLLNLAHVYCLVGDETKALQTNELATNLQPKDPQTHSHWASTLSEFGHFEAAVQRYRAALKVDPEHVDAWHHLGNCLMNLQRPTEAREAFDKSIGLDPNSPQMRFNSGMCFLKLNSNLQALDDFRTSIKLNPDYDQPRECLINQLRLQGEPEKALEEIELWLAHAPANPIAEHLRASITGEDTPERASNEYLARVFDRFSDQFDSSLEHLEYKAPQLVADAVSRLNLPADASLDVIDAGCGTGLCGPLLKPWARRLIGVDLSDGMLKQARKRHLYDELICAELTEYFQSQKQLVQLIVSADTFIYFGRLNELMIAISNSLHSGGHVVFTSELLNSTKTPQASFELGGHGRYSHAHDYVRRCLEDAGFELLQASACCLRLEAGRPVQGMVYVARASRK